MVQFQCAIAGYPLPWSRWSKDNRDVTQNPRIAIKERNDLRILEIAGVTPEDGGLYCITIENEYGKNEYGENDSY